MPTKFRDLEKVLRAHGYNFDHATGSHYIYAHPTKPRVTRSRITAATGNSHRLH